MVAIQNHLLFISIFCYCLVQLTDCRKHHLVLKNDKRLFFPVSTFGYNIGGQLIVNVKNLTIDTDIEEKPGEPPSIGLTLIRSTHLNHPFNDDNKLMRSCYLHNPKTAFSDDIITMGISFADKEVKLKCFHNTRALWFGMPATYHHHRPQRRGAPPFQPNERPFNVSESSEIGNMDGDIRPPEDGANKSVSSSPSIVNQQQPSEPTNNGRNITELFLPETQTMDLLSHEDRSKSCLFKSGRDTLSAIPLYMTLDARERISVSFNFSIKILQASEEGVYFLTFHNCKGKTDEYGFSKQELIDLDVYVYETNYLNNYLSAGHIPLPQLYFALSVLFFLVGTIWMNFMWQQRENALKIHYLMTLLIFAKTSSLFFHAINYHYIAMDGSPVETWAYLFYVSRLIKGALFFITIILIGSGWTFIKHMLSDKDKKIVLIIVPLQILANIVNIVFDESVEGELKRSFWNEITTLIDLACCGAILFPIVWSVRHLQEASHTDGKAAINLKKLELFRHFYIMIVGYIYFTRIITYLLQAVLSFKYYWLTVVLSEVATLVFFVVTGYFFQPIPTNPYLLLSQDDDLELEEDVLFSVGPELPNAYSKPYTRSNDGQAIPDSQRLIKRDLDDPEL